MGSLELVELRKTVMAAILLTRDDFIKATEDVAAEFQVREDAHLARMKQIADQQQYNVQAARDALAKDKEALATKEAELAKSQAKLLEDQEAHRATCAQAEEQQRQRRQELELAIRQHAETVALFEDKSQDVLKREDRLNEIDRAINAERQEMRDKEARMRELVGQHG